jgi:transcriptional accessory protein Tex/SPT6
MVTVTEVEISRKRIALSMKTTPTTGAIQNERSKTFASKETYVPKANKVETTNDMYDALAALKNKFGKG